MIEDRKEEGHATYVMGELTKLKSRQDSDEFGFRSMLSKNA